MNWKNGCPNCGAGSKHSAFVDFAPEPNGAQEETEWSDGLVTLKGIVCTECSHVYGVFDPRDVGEEKQSNTSKFRVDEELR